MSGADQDGRRRAVIEARVVRHGRDVNDGADHDNLDDTRPADGDGEGGGKGGGSGTERAFAATPACPAMPCYAG